MLSSGIAPQTGGLLFFRGSMQPRIPFKKPATTISQQIDKLLERGMIITNIPATERVLAHVHYYRLVSYWLPFELNHGTHQLKPGTTFEQVHNLYNFDRKLRLHLFSAIEEIESSFRSIWAHQMALSHGPHAHLDSNLAVDRKEWIQNIQTLLNETERSTELFISHFKNKYSEMLPPIWASCEVMSLGQLSRWYKSIKPLQTRQSISRSYHLDEGLLESWIHAISIIRNHCAHHSRLWNRDCTVLPAVPKSRLNLATTNWNPGSRKIYNTVVTIAYLLDQIEPDNVWKLELKNLISLHSIDPSAMGFPANWQTGTFWT